MARKAAKQAGPTPVDSIGDDSTEQRERYQRDRLEEPDEPDVQRRVGEQIDLVRDGDETQLRPGEGHELAEPEQAERA